MEMGVTDLPNGRILSKQTSEYLTDRLGDSTVIVSTTYILACPITPTSNVVIESQQIFSVKTKPLNSPVEWVDRCLLQWYEFTLI